MNRAIANRNGRRVWLTVLAALGVVLLILGFECYGRWVARNMAVITKAAVEAPRSETWSTAAAPVNSVVVLAGDTVAEITSIVTSKRSEESHRPETGFVALLTDSTAGRVISRDSGHIAVLVRETPLVVDIRRKKLTDSVLVARLWIVDLPRFIPVYSNTENGRSLHRRP
jgi:hypothetical protein